MIPVSTPTSVDLPAPLRPTSARELPAGTRIETLLSAWLSAEVLGDAEHLDDRRPGRRVVPRPVLAAHHRIAGRQLGRSALSAVCPQGRIVDVGLGDRRRRQHVHRVAVEHLDAAVMVGRAGAKRLSGDRVCR